MKALVSTLLFIVLFAVYFAAEADAAVDKEIVLAMAFDEGEGETAKDLSTHENHGALKGNVNWGVGKFGNAVQIERHGHVDAGDDRSLKLYKSDFTLAAWVNMNETLFGHRHAFIAQDEGPGWFNKWIIGYGLNGNPTLNVLSVSGDGNGGASSGKIIPREVQPKTWHQVAMVRRRFKDGRDGLFWEELTVYLNGEQISHGKIGSNSPDDIIPRFNDAPVTIGFAEEDVWLDGLIDEVLIATRALSDDEITAHFQGGIKRGLGLAVQLEGKSAAVWGAIKAQMLR